MNVLLSITSRIACTVTAFLTYIIIFTVATEVHPVSFLIFLLMGGYIAWKGLLSLLLVSFIVDEYFITKFLIKLRYKAHIFLRIFIYGVLGMIIAKILYHDDEFFILSGTFISVIYIIYLQAYNQLDKSFQDKYNELDSNDFGN
ncbi:hypothetical protein [Paenibacillus anseongense]|uniref:hypothetical protein n=1 Tax=Paenibacillus anseongense TaxID=2682845 RepID=UPI002DB5E21B|nr:hypothetical protein [Paenibacillus anseongense]MEC0270443.1 hypothetical protein [Paenibacillus anseongense]